jgi:hypothetical protein
MERTHNGMTVAQRRLLQFWLDGRPKLREVYEELNGELPMPEHRWEDELDSWNRDSWVDAMPSVDAWLEPGAEGE